MFIVDTFNTDALTTCLTEILNQFDGVPWTRDRVEGTHHDRNGLLAQHEVKQLLVLATVFSPRFGEIFKADYAVELVLLEDRVDTLGTERVPAVTKD